MSEREIERILQECDNEEEVEKAIEEYLKKVRKYSLKIKNK